MRYLPLSRLQPGMVLGQSLCGNKFEVLLIEGVTLTARHIQRINDLGYSGAYIADELSGEVEPNYLLSVDTWITTARETKELLQHAKAGFPTKHMPKVSRDRQERIMMPVIESIIRSNPRMLDVYDLKPFDNYPYFHAVGVAVLSLLIGVEMGLTGPQLFELGMASLLHDVGNAFVPQHLLDKPGKLTKAEYAIVQSHSERGFQALRDNYDISIEACMGALQHHENYDGTGYPNQLDKSRISIYGRIIGATDVFDALVSRRPYRGAFTPAQALDKMESRSGTMFDPEVVDYLTKVVARYPAGACIELDDGIRCMVVKNSPQTPDRPKCKLLDRTSGAPAYIDLGGDPQYRDVHITRVVEV